MTVRNYDNSKKIVVRSLREAISRGELIRDGKQNFDDYANYVKSVVDYIQKNENDNRILEPLDSFPSDKEAREPKFIIPPIINYFLYQNRPSVQKKQTEYVDEVCSIFQTILNRIEYPDFSS